VSGLLVVLGWLLAIFGMGALVGASLMSHRVSGYQRLALAVLGERDEESRYVPRVRAYRALVKIARGTVDNNERTYLFDELIDPLWLTLSLEERTLAAAQPVPK
jgi:hypothetical protein